jgi:CHAT domain-containing protein
VFTRAGASEAKIKSVHLERYRIIHIATHGLLPSETKALGAKQSEPALVFTPPNAPGEVDDGLLTASEVASLRLNAEWAVLSACNTAAGESSEALAFSGLAKAFLYAGARAVLVSHWPVYSDAAVKIVTNTFARMQRDKKVGKAEALRESMGEIVERGSAAKAHPSYWAPFVLVGDGR